MPETKCFLCLCTYVCICLGVLHCTNIYKNKNNNFSLFFEGARERVCNVVGIRFKTCLANRLRMIKSVRANEYCVYVVIVLTVC